MEIDNDSQLTVISVEEPRLGDIIANKRVLTEKQISKMMKTIRPTVRRGHKLFYIAPVDPEDISFTWNPKKTAEATGLVEIGRIHTLHTFGHYGLFKPSVSEVFSMIPEKLVETVKAFEVIAPEDPKWDSINAGYHVGIAVLYA